MSQIMRKKLQRLRSDWNVLSDKEDMGCFNFETLTIEVCKFTSEEARFFDDVDFKFNGDLMLFNNYKQYHSLLVHECTHCIDVLNTVWGLEYLWGMSKGYSASDFYQRNEYNFIESKSFFDYSRSIKMPEYYTQVFDVDGNPEDWNIRITAGIVFNSNGGVSDRPIFFGSFFKKNGDVLVRSPISMISLLEASASIQEYYAEYKIIEGLQEDIQKHCRAQLEGRLKKEFYNKKSTEYSVCLHWVANRQLSMNLVPIIPITKILLDVCLNITNKMMSEIDVIRIYYSSDSYRRNVDRQSEAFLRIKDGIRKYHNRGCLFYLLVDMLPEQSYRNPMGSLNLVLGYSGLSYNDIMNAARERVSELVVNINKGEVLALKKMVNGMLDNFNYLHPSDGLSPFLMNFDVLKKINMPPVLMEDFSFFEVGKPDGNFAGFDFEVDIFNELYAGSKWVRKFNEACIF